MMEKKYASFLKNNGNVICLRKVDIITADLVEFSHLTIFKEQLSSPPMKYLVETVGRDKWLL